MTPEHVGDQHFDAAVLLTAHDDVDFQAVATAASVVLDTRGVLSGENVEYL